jgi:hypothetical protein
MSEMQQASSIVELQSAILAQMAVQRVVAEADMTKAHELRRQTDEMALSRAATEQHTQVLQRLIERMETLLDTISVFVSDDRIGIVQKLLEATLPVIVRLSGTEEEKRRLERLIERIGRRDISISSGGGTVVGGDVVTSGGHFTGRDGQEEG